VTTDISVVEPVCRWLRYGSRMSDLVFVAALAADLSRVHSAQRVVEVLFAAVQQRCGARGVVVRHAQRELVCGALRGEPRRTLELLDGAGSLAIDAAVDVALADALAAIVSSALRHVAVVERVATLSRRAHVEARELRRRILALENADDLVAASPSSRRLVHEILPAVARHDTTVLLRGETGTGKEVLARRIHALSRRHARAFVQVNCGAIPEALVESTLFGHERGAFTGAVSRQRGLFEQAHLGTLLLDEIGDLPLAAQVKLLRVLQSGQLERVGGDRGVAVDVRVIGATNRPLEQMVATRTFREDLYYRVNVFPIVIAPLRERPEDLDALVTAFVARGAQRLGQAPVTVPDSVRRKLRRHAWPGNVRELENVLERALVLGRGGQLRIPFALTTMPAPDAGVESLAAATRRSIERALTASEQRIYGPGGAAARLGLKPSTLQSKMAKLGITRAAT